MAVQINQHFSTAASIGSLNCHIEYPDRYLQSCAVLRLFETACTLRAHVECIISKKSQFRSQVLSKCFELLNFSLLVLAKIRTCCFLRKATMPKRLFIYAANSVILHN